MDEELDELVPPEPAGEPAPPVEPPAPKEQTVPLSRFQEVYHKQKELEGEIAALKEEKKTGGLTPEQEKELQAKQYLKTLLKETLSEHEAAQTKATLAEEETFKREVDEILLAHPEVNRDGFLKFIEEKAETYGLETVSGSMRVYLDLQNASKTGAEKARSEWLGKPSLPTSEGTKPIPGPPPEDRNRSFGAVVQDIIKGLK